MYLFLKTIKINKVFHLILIIQMTLLLILISTETEKLIEQYEINHYITAEKDMYYISGIIEAAFVDNNISYKELERLINKIQKEDNVKLGYECFTEANLNNQQVYMIYASPIMRKITYLLDCGSWIDDSKESQVILGYNFKKKYKIGDKILIRQSNQNFVYAEVKGFFKAGSRFIQLNSASDGKIDYELMLDKLENENIVFSNDENIINWSDVKVPSQSLVAQGKQQDVKKLSKYGSINSFEEIKTNSRSGEWKAYRTSGIYVLSLALLFFNSIVLIAIIAYKKNKNLFRIYFLCGMPKGKIFIYSMASILIDCIITILMDIVVIVILNKTLINGKTISNSHYIDIKVIGIYLLATITINFVQCILIIERIGKNVERDGIYAGYTGKYL